MGFTQREKVRLHVFTELVGFWKNGQQFSQEYNHNASTLPDLLRTWVQNPLDCTDWSAIISESFEASLSAELTLEELHVALLSLAPGIDGIPMEFYKTFWTLLVEDWLDFFKGSLLL